MASGGYRPGAGRPRGSKNKFRQETGADIAVAAAAEDITPLEYMLRVMRDPREDKDRRARMAIACAPFIHPKAGEGKGKKELASERAKAASEKFAAGRPPLTVLNTKGG